MAGPLPKSQQIKRSHFKLDDDFLAALRKQRPGEPQKVFLRRCDRADKYEEHKRTIRFRRFQRRDAYRAVRRERQLKLQMAHAA